MTQTGGGGGDVGEFMTLAVGSLNKLGGQVRIWKCHLEFKSMSVKCMA